MQIKKLLFSIMFVLFSLGSASAQDKAPRPDLMSFAYGVLPISVDTGGTDLRTGMTQAISVIDGNTVGFVMTQKPGTNTDVVEITYALPALTQFDRFAVPNVRETPSPSQTFFKSVDILGADQSAEGPFVPLAKGELNTHEDVGQVTELTLEADIPEVRWVKVRFSDGVSVEADKTFFEFSELIGNGSQRAPDLSDGFDGVWKGRGVKIELAQDGPSVNGCYDGRSKLTGTVEGKVLRALGADDAGIESQFILIAGEDGVLRGLRSTNGAPFKPYDGDASPNAPSCLAPEPPTLGCDAVVHGIGFDFDSDRIRTESQPIIEALYAGLSRDSSNSIRIVGHSSSEGAADYNRDLSQRRANSLVEALVALGLNANALSADGRGEDEPIASNDDEAGRSLNRRVEILCSG